MVDLNFHKVIKYFFSIFFFFLFSSKSFSENFTFKKLADLNDPWGSSFVNDKELIITEKTGKIKIVNIISEEVYEVEHNLNYFVHGQGGLLDIIYQDNYLWISYSEIIFTIFIFPVFSVIISSPLLIKDDPHGSFKSVNFLKVKFSEKLFDENNKKKNIDKKYLITL